MSLMNDTMKALDPARIPQMVTIPVYRDDLADQMEALQDLIGEDGVTPMEPIVDLVNFLQDIWERSES